jgi:hypothetical protein
MDTAAFCRRLTIGVLLLAFSVHDAWGAQTRQDRGDRPSSTGIDQTEIVGRYSANYVYVEKDNGTRRHNLGLGFEKDVSGSVKLGFVVPVTYAERSDGEDAFGLGEVKLNGGWRFYHSPQLSALLALRVVLDTSTDEILGDGSYKVQPGMAASWRKSKWLLTLAGACTMSEDSDQNDVSLSPLLGYQPMGKYLSYITLGPTYSYGLETEEDALSVTVFMGKVLPNRDVLALGTQYNIEGVDDNKAFLLLSWRRLF